MSDHRNPDPKNEQPSPKDASGNADAIDLRVRELAALLDQISHDVSSDDLRKDLYRLKKRIFDLTSDWARCAQEREKMEEVLEKLSSPAFRMGTLLGKTEEGLGWIAVGGSDYFCQIDPRIGPDALETGQRVRLNEALSIVGTETADPFGTVVQVSKVLPDGRLEIGGDKNVAGAPAAVVGRAASLNETVVLPGDSLRLDNTSRLAVEYLGGRQESHLLEEVPDVSWKDVGGQKKAIEEIRKAILNPFLHQDLYTRYRFRSPKGFLLHGPPGCGKTLIGKATAHQLAKEMEAMEGRPVKGVFFHIKGPEIFNMWLGESERIVRELFEQGREARKRGDFPVLFIDEAEAILGTRRSIRSFNIHNTLVPMFCAEMDGMSGPNGFMVILATNRPEMIDPAILRPGRIDRKIRVMRPDRQAAEEIVRLYLTAEIPIERVTGEDPEERAREDLVEKFLDKLYARTESNAVLEVVLRSGRREILYRSDLASGALLASIVDRAKEKALLREMEAAGKDVGGVSLSDLFSATEDEFLEGDIVPATEGAEDWMSLLDLRQRDVVDLKKFDSSNRERKVLERRAIE
ncbi:MAG: AAA family ATPase [Nitrospirae bacterium]|jgi:proteasome-associated ATPase|nr:AAA family ATPase [Nitrospirota bacterium]